MKKEKLKQNSNDTEVELINSQYKSYFHLSPLRTKYGNKPPPSTLQELAKTTTSLPDFYMNTSKIVGQDPEKSPINPIEKANLKNFIDKRWKEIVMLEAEKRKELMKKEKQAQQESNKIPTHKENSGSLQKQTSGILQKQISGNLQKQTSIRELERGNTLKQMKSISPKSGSEKSSRSASEESAKNSEKSKVLPPGKLTHLELDKQVQERRKAANKIAEKLAALTEKNEKIMQRNMSESSKIEQGLERFEQKLARAADRTQVSTLEKVIVASRTSQALSKIIAQTEAVKEAKRMNFERIYSEKMMKIEQSKKFRQTQMKEITEKRIKKSMEDKLKQDEKRKLWLEKMQEEQKLVEENLQKKSVRHKKNISVFF